MVVGGWLFWLNRKGAENAVMARATRKVAPSFLRLFKAV